MGADRAGCDRSPSLLPSGMQAQGAAGPVFHRTPAIWTLLRKRPFKKKTDWQPMPFRSSVCGAGETHGGAALSLQPLTSESYRLSPHFLWRQTWSPALPELVTCLHPLPRICYAGFESEGHFFSLFSSLSVHVFPTPSSQLLPIVSLSPPHPPTPSLSQAFNFING